MHDGDLVNKGRTRAGSEGMCWLTWLLVLGVDLPLGLGGGGVDSLVQGVPLGRGQQRQRVGGRSIAVAPQRAVEVLVQVGGQVGQPVLVLLNLPALWDRWCVHTLRLHSMRLLLHVAGIDQRHLNGVEAGCERAGAHH